MVIDISVVDKKAGYQFNDWVMDTDSLLTTDTSAPEDDITENRNIFIPPDRPMTSGTE